MGNNIDVSQIKWDSPQQSSPTDDKKTSAIDESQIKWDSPLQSSSEDADSVSIPHQSGQNAPSPLNPIQSGAVGLVNNPSNIPQALQNTGVDPKRITLGDKGETLVDGIDINKTGLNNINDFTGAVARGLTSNLPLLSQVGGDVAAGLLAPETAGASLGTLAAFNAATSATGEAVRQLASKGISGENFNAGSMGTQAVLGAASPYVGKILDTTYNATKIGLLNTLDKVATKDGVDGLVAMGNHLVSNLDPKTTITAIDKVRNGDLRILDEKYADEGQFQENLQGRLFGENGNTASHIQRTYGSTPAGEQAAKELYSHALGVIPEEDVSTLLKQGSSVSRMARPGALTSLGEDIGNAANTLLDVNGKNLRAAQGALLGKARGVQTDLTDINGKLAATLQKVGFLEQVSGADGRIGYKINPKFDVTSTGSAQKNIFGDLVDRFFQKADGKTLIGNKESNRTAESYAKGLQYKSAADAWNNGGEAVKEGLTQAGYKPQDVASMFSDNRPVYFPDNKMTYGNLYDKIKNINVQIGDKEFDKVGELSPDLAGFMKGLRGKTSEVAQKVGNKSVPFFNTKYGELADTLRPVMKAARDKDGLSMENYMKSIANNSSEKQLINGSDINNLLKKEGVNMFDDLDAYRASKSLEKLNSPIVRSQVAKKFGDTLESAYGDNPRVGVFNSIKQSVDSALPKSKQFSDLAETHILAKGLSKDTTNIFKAGFLAHGLNIAGVVGMATGHPLATLTATGAGLALQKPAIRKGLIELSARHSGKFSKSFTPVNRSTTGRILGALITHSKSK